MVMLENCCDKQEPVFGGQRTAGFFFGTMPPHVLFPVPMGIGKPTRIARRADQPRRNHMHTIILWTFCTLQEI